jgi:HEAT repeat protein
MNTVHTMLMALLAVSGATFAQTATESSDSVEVDVRALAAQAEAEADETDAERSSRERETRRRPTDQEALALAAMEGLMSQPPERALPLIKKVLAGSQTTLVKKRALFVLSQIESPEAEQILVQTARSPDKSLRSEAIRSIGIGGNAKSLAALQEVYDAGDADIKKQVLDAWMIAGRKEEVYRAAINARSEAEASEAIRMLGVMGAVDELRKLGDRPNPSRGLLDAYAIGGDLASLRKIAEGGGERSIRVEAVQKIGIVGDEAARAALRDIYSRSSDDKIKDAALQGMLIAGDDQGVLALYRSAKTTAEKQELLRTLTMMDGDAAMEAIDAALEDKK